MHDLVVAELDLTGTPLGDLIVERRAVGLAEYNTVLQVEDPARDDARDLLEELGDALCYAYRVRARRGGALATSIFERVADLAREAADAWYREAA